MGLVLSEHGQRELPEAFDAHDFVVGEPVKIGDLAVTALRVDHVPNTFALVVEGGGARLCYTSDTRLGDEVRTAARGADVLLAEATLPPEYAGRAPHMTSAEAGTLATEVGAHTLVLTHLWPTVDRDAAAAAAAGQFGGRVIVADELESLDIDRQEAARATLGRP
jgi:ribonuclease BN (tRNA processing enzyme)